MWCPCRRSAVVKLIQEEVHKLKMELAPESVDYGNIYEGRWTPLMPLEWSKTDTELEDKIKHIHNQMEEIIKSSKFKDPHKMSLVDLTKMVEQASR